MDAHDAGADRAVVRVLYVIGWSRSGSTLLDLALGSFPGVESTGELRYLWERGLATGDRCGCGVPVPDCPRWRAVLDRVTAARHDRGARPARPAPAEVVGLQRDVARLRHTPTIVGADGPRLRALRGLTHDLARAISVEAGAEVVVDSSKRPPDAALYLGADDVRLHLVHLVRDPRAVAHSWQRPKLRHDAARPYEMNPHPPLRSSGHWLVWNLLAEWLAPHAASYRRVRYEDLVADPGRVLTQVLGDVGLSADTRRVVTTDGLRVAPNHTVAGNPNRLSRGTIPIRVDDAWTRDQAAGHRVAATVPSLPLLRRYGYPVRAGVATTPS